MNTYTDSQLATRNKLVDMLTENTGRHILDSGMANGRHWQQNQGLTLEACLLRPTARWERGWYTTVDLFHYLDGLVYYTRPAELLDKVFAKYSAQSNDSHMEDIETFIELIGGTLGRGDNSYNRDSDPLSQCYQYQTAYFESVTLANLPMATGLTSAEEAELTASLEGLELVFLQIHGGADIRGGYTRPVVFEYDEALEYAPDYTLTCTPCNLTIAVSYGDVYNIETSEYYGKDNPFDEAEGCPNCKGDLIAEA